MDTRHPTDAQSRITHIEVDDGSTPVTTNHAYDASGNLIFDGTYCYQNDAWIRLIQINNASSTGSTYPIGTAFEADDLVKHYTYDGLGRLARTISPFPAPGEPGDYVRSERFFYDGIRRIQEVYTDPLLDLGEAYAQGEGGAQEAFNEDPELDPEGLTGGSESGQTGETGETGGTGDPGDPGPPEAPPVVYLAREYVWGPGDGPGSGTGIYELLAIFDENREPWWAVQDAGQAVVALIDAGAITPGGSTGGPGVGNGFGDGSNSAARLVGEFSYTAYGELLTAASHAPHPDPRLGHKGLFLDRLDTGVVDPLTGAEIARHVLGAKHTYFMVNRSYDPQLGRFLQRDPNATGLPLIAEAIYTGSALGGGVNAFGLDSHIVDGVGVYGYVTSNPWTKSDPLGLAPEDDLYNLLREEFLGDLPEFDDPFDQADAIGFQHAMSGVMAVQRSLSKTSRLMKHVRAYESIGWAWAELVMDRDAGILTGMVIGPFFSRICFEEGTLVAVPGGTETIESLSLGDRVLSYQDPHALGGEAVILPAASEIVCITLTYRHEDGETTTMEMLRPAAAVGRLGLFPGRRLAVHLPEMGIRGTAVIEGVEAFAPSVRTDVPVVTGHFVTSQAEVVDLFLEGEGRPIGVTPGHPFFSLDRAAWVGASELRQGERLASLRGEVRVQEVVPRPERVMVYNVEVSHLHTYFVGEAGVWVHNPCFLTDSVRQAMNAARAAGRRVHGSKYSAFKLGDNMYVGQSHIDLIKTFKEFDFSKGWAHGYAIWDDLAQIFRWSHR